jgi:hypothetical protein
MPSASASIVVDVAPAVNTAGLTVVQDENGGALVLPLAQTSQYIGASVSLVHATATTPPAARWHRGHRKPAAIGRGQRAGSLVITGVWACVTPLRSIAESRVLWRPSARRDFMWMVARGERGQGCSWTLSWVSGSFQPTSSCMRLSIALRSGSFSRRGRSDRLWADSLTRGAWPQTQRTDRCTTTPNTRSCTRRWRGRCIQPARTAWREGLPITSWGW